MQKISQMIEMIEARAPLSCAESWDNVGLICGDSKQKLKGVAIGVDLTEALLKFAVQKKANLIILHHPPIFPKGRGVGRLILGRSNDLNTLLLQAFKLNLCVYVAHTNFDRCALDGMIALSYALGSTAVARVWEEPEEGETLLKKLVTYIPVDHFEAVRDALYMVGCGHIGNYDCCGFGISGFGNFRPLSGASPFFGKVGELEEKEEIRLETIFVSGMEGVVLETLKNAHPYEEVAYDLYPLENQIPATGLGRLGELAETMTFGEFAAKVKIALQADHVRAVGDSRRLVKIVAVCGGAGASVISQAAAAGADVLVTGDVKYHEAQAAQQLGLAVIDAGHFATERPAVDGIASYLKDCAARGDWSVTINTDILSKDVFQVY